MINTQRQLVKKLLNRLKLNKTVFKNIEDMQKESIFYGRQRGSQENQKHLRSRALQQ